MFPDYILVKYSCIIMESQNVQVYQQDYLKFVIVQELIIFDGD